MQLLDRVEELSGIEDREAIERASRAVVSVLFEQLTAHDRAWLERLLPRELRSAHTDIALRPSDRLDEFYDRVAQCAGTSVSRAAELALVICRALGERLDDDEQRLLTGRLPDALSELFARHESAPPQAPPTAPRSRAKKRTLADGRPGSQRPLSESAPPPAHENSVARSENPHGDTKLSSNRGMTQEREAETLAEADPGPHPQRS